MSYHPKQGGHELPVPVHTELRILLRELPEGGSFFVFGIAMVNFRPPSRILNRLCKI